VTVDIGKRGEKRGLVSASPENPISYNLFLCYAPLRTSTTFLILNFSQTKVVHDFECVATIVPAHHCDSHLRFRLRRRSSAHDRC
jgi:hypothetical protein